MDKKGYHKFRRIREMLVKHSMLFLTLLSLLFAVIIGISLYYKSVPILEQQSIWELLSGKNWKPLKGEFGFYPFIMGTLWVTGIAVLLSLPLCLLSAIYLSEYAHPYLRKIVYPMIDVLAGIPPVVYGVWGVLVVVPFISDTLAPHFVEFSTGYSILAGGIVLGIMIIPLMISVFIEIFEALPTGLREASLSLGATNWQTIKKVVLRKSFPGLAAAVVLAISRAFGETIAVLMVCGNISEVPHSIFDPAYPLPALIANNYGEMMSIPLYDSALMLSALLLFIIILAFNAISRLVLIRIEKNFAL
ncbi:MAG TPA: phosphate ABC transporter permease subunit PstC [Prolixibacteraceae bacterium]|nr:phosphate ABC transporter permease subunit PstC [Prolixibacteraceae bacterium]